MQIIHKLSSKFNSQNDEGKRQTYFDMQKSGDGWKYHVELMLYLRGLMAEDMLSERFTALKPLEKDAAQRAYAMVDKVVLFLLDPQAEARKLASIMAHNAKIQGATAQGATKPKGK